MVESGGQLRVPGGRFAVGARVGGAAHGLDESGPTVAEGCVGEQGELSFVGDARGQRVLRGALAAAVAEGEGGELVDAGDVGVP
ncbi:hypothetical protein AB0I60_37300 [Actinosynnema sp. NPDC050436]|uniref:hypothetical protein n=1 Tax=Actinosynnema sp. NPDC050436 TaxID=3155659 RepID=UPI0033DAEF5A